MRYILQHPKKQKNFHKKSLWVWNFESLDKIYNKYKYNKDSIAKYDYLSEYILNLYNYKIIEKDDVNKLYWNGNYYQDVKNDYKKMKK